jgi:peroxiredoxin
MKTFFLIFCVAFIAYTSKSQAQDDPVKYGIDVNFGVPSGLKPGDTAPDFSASDVNNNMVTLAKELENGPVVIIFYRGEWCPVCNRYLSNFQDSLSYVVAAGAKVLAITPEQPSSALKMIKKTGATFTVIPDPTEQIMQRYEVIFSVTEAYQDRIKNKLEADIASNNEKKDAKLPVPATYIINKEGIVVYRQFDLDYHIRASVKDILDNIPH